MVRAFVHQSDRAGLPRSPAPPVGQALSRMLPSRSFSLTGTVQRAAVNPQTLSRADVRQLQRTLGNAAVGRILTDGVSRAGPAGLPDRVKTSVETLSGFSMDDVRVYYNSSKPAEVGALATAQGSAIHLAPRQERHLPHEAWHVVQQKQGRVAQTRTVNGVAINDDRALEREAEIMATRTGPTSVPERRAGASSDPSPDLWPRGTDIVQRKVGFEYELGGISTEKNTSSWAASLLGTGWGPHGKGEVIVPRTNYDITADINQSKVGRTQIEFITHAIDETKPDELAKLTKVATDICDDIKAIDKGNTAQVMRSWPFKSDWVRADQIARFGGSWRHRFSATKFSSLNGQLQMTAGIRADRLADVISGSALGPDPVAALNKKGNLSQQGDARVERDLVAKYYQRSPKDKDTGKTEAMQPIWIAAKLAVDQQFDDWRPLHRRHLASLIALMAILPIEKRVGLALSMGGSGLYIAKTDFAKIFELFLATICNLQIAASKTKTNLPKRDSLTFEEYEKLSKRHSELALPRLLPDRFLIALLRTINTTVPEGKRVDSNSDIFPIEHKVLNVSFSGLSLKQWTEKLMPKSGPAIDLLTSTHFPGTPAQRKEVRAYGTFGSRTDPGHKAILEWRSLGHASPDDLVPSMNRMAKLVARFNK